MREILFRGKRKDNGEWVEGHYATIQNPFSEDGRPVKHLICNGTNIFNYEIDPETVSEFTSLCDKNGKKVFEGDIIKGAWGVVVQVVYDECYLGFLARDDMLFQHSIDYYGLDKIEVIGNIHDNPELLRKEDEGK